MQLAPPQQTMMGDNRQSMVMAASVGIVLLVAAIIFIVAGAGLQGTRDDERNQQTWYGGYAKNPATVNALITVSIILGVGVFSAAVAGAAISRKRPREYSDYRRSGPSW
jgi:hypothetical protein